MKAVIRRITNWDIAKLSFFLFVIVASVLIFTLTPSLFPSALVSVLLFFIFSPLIDGAERKGISRTTGILAVFLVCGVVIAVAAGTVMPRVAREINAFQAGSAHYTANITEKLRHQQARLLADYPLLRQADITDKVIDWLQHSTERVWTVFPDLASHLMMLCLLVPFLTFVLLKDAHEIRRNLLKLVPNRYFETIYGLTSRILEEMGGFVAARIIEAALVTAMVTLGCVALKIPYAILLGVFAGATNAIPYLGPLLGAAPGLALAVLDPAIPNQLVWVTLIYSVANLIDMAVIFPLLVAKIVDLHPVVVVISVVLGSQIFGIVGMVVAVPITSIVKILIQEVYSRVYSQAGASTAFD